MPKSYPVALFLLVPLAWGSALQAQYPIQDQERLPDVIDGNHPFQYCHWSATTDLFQIDWIDMLPNPPKMNEEITLQMSGRFLEDIGPNSTLSIFGTVYDTQLDYQFGNGSVNFTFCNFWDRVEQEDSEDGIQCPPQRGQALLFLWGMIPSQLFSEGYYKLRWEAMTKDRTRMFCLDTEFDLQKLKD